MKTIGIIGTRRKDKQEDFIKVKNAFDEIYENGDWIVSGGCRQGGDKFAEMIARQNGIPIIIFHANWNKYGRVAGFKRNDQIAAKSSILIACVAEDRKGGTEDTIKKFKKFYPNRKVILV